MHKEEKKKNRAAIALTLCFCVMALTSVFAVKASLEKIQNTLDPAATAQEDSAQSNQEAAAKTPVVDSQDNDSSKQSGSGSENAAAPYINPVDGSVQLKYSMDALVYSKTLDQYMTHPGVDLSAQLSSEVKAIAAGTVTNVYTDDRYGITVEITHDNGIISTYSNLAKQGLAEVGDEVSKGDKIGCIGKTALFESQEASHLHLQIQKDNALVDPCSLIEDL